MSDESADNGQDWVEEAISGVPALATVVESAALLRMSPRNFYRLIAAGKVRSVRSSEGGSSPHLVPRGELARYLRSLEGKAGRAA